MGPAGAGAGGGGLRQGWGGGPLSRLRRQLPRRGSQGAAAGRKTGDEGARPDEGIGPYRDGGTAAGASPRPTGHPTSTYHPPCSAPPKSACADGEHHTGACKIGPNTPPISEYPGRRPVKGSSCVTFTHTAPTAPHRVLPQRLTAYPTPAKGIFAAFVATTKAGPRQGVLPS